jgi:hypothetical protein
MMKAAFLLPLVLVACTEPSGEERSVSSLAATPRRARLERLARADALARLYIGRSLRPAELASLTDSEAAIVEALARRPEFGARFAARLGDYASAYALAPRSESVDPTVPLIDVFGGDRAEAGRFASWLFRTLAPLHAEARLPTEHTRLGEMTYRELLETLRRPS